VSRFVLDCSMTMAWCFEDETTPRTDAVLATIEFGEAVVPAHWRLEVANALVVAERRKRVLPARVREFANFVSRLPIDIDDETAEKALGDTLALARKCGLTAYDAAYLELAMREGCPLASLDEPLNEAAAGLGVALYQG
jgi:predicted nucleic acid-binding protein